MPQSIVIVLVLIALWYIATVLANATLVREAFERSETSYTTFDLISGTLSAERPLVVAPHQMLLAFWNSVSGYPPDSPRSLLYHGWVTLSATLVGFLIGTAFGILLSVLIVHLRTLEKSLMPWIICSQMVPILAVAPIVIVVLGAIGMQGLLPKSIISAYLCFFPVTIGMVKGLTSPGRDRARPDAHLVGDTRAGFLEAALALVDAVPVREPQSGDHHFAGRRHRRRIADRRAGRHRRAAARRLLLRPDCADLGGAVHRGTDGRRVGRHHRRGRAAGAPPHGSAVVTARWSALLLAAFGLILTALGCTATLLWLRDPAVEGAAGAGFWAITLATWFVAILTVSQLAAFTPRSRGLRRLQDLLIPLLFGAFVLYLWEVAVRGFGVPRVLMPSPSATATRFAASLPILAEDFVQTFVRGVLPGYAIGCGSGFLMAIVANRFAFLGRGLLPLGNFASALPIVGIAPIMVMWFGFDWPSKAAVVAVITFFPMLVNTLAGLGRHRRDRARSDALLCGDPAADAYEAQPAGGHAVHLQRAEDQFDPRPDRRYRGRVLRNADPRHRLSHFDRSGTNVA